jgi:hypothetical protein
LIEAFCPRSLYRQSDCEQPNGLLLRVRASPSHGDEADFLAMFFAATAAVAAIEVVRQSL